MQRQYNLRNPAVKRLMKEAQELREPTEQYHAQPLEDNLFEWHFTIRGPGESEFEAGIYHGRIVLPPEYPMKPPSIIILTPNGRFEVNKKICLSISGYHPESWQPSWSIRTALLAIIGFMPTHGAGAIGSLDYTPQERKVLAKRSQSWKCPSCGDISNVLPQVTEASKETSKEARELATQISFQAEKEKKPTESDSVAGVNTVPTSSDTTVPLSSSVSVTNSSSVASSTASSFQQFSTPTQPLPSVNSFRFPFPPPPYSAFPSVNHWQAAANNPQAAATSTTAPPTFPMPFVSMPFPPMFPPPGPHMFAGRPPVFPPGWPRPGFHMGYRPASTVSSPTTGSSLPTAVQPTVSDNLTTPVSSTNSQQVRSGADNSPSSLEARSADNSGDPHQTTSATDIPSQGSATSDSQSTTDSSVRHRLPRDQPAPASSPTPSPTPERITARRLQNRGGDRVTLFLTLLTFIVAVLLMRRLYMTDV